MLTCIFLNYYLNYNSASKLFWEDMNLSTYIFACAYA